MVNSKIFQKRKKCANSISNNRFCEFFPPYGKLSNLSTGYCQVTNISIKEQKGEDDIGVHPKYIKGKIEMLKNSSIIQIANITMS